VVNVNVVVVRVVFHIVQSQRSVTISYRKHGAGGSLSACKHMEPFVGTLTSLTRVNMWLVAYARANPASP